MCEPMMIGIIGAIGSAASAFASYSAQQDAMNKQNQANEQWVAYQRRERQEAMLREEQARQQSEAARQQALQDMEAGKQKQAQVTEQERVKKDITPSDIPQDPTQDVPVGDELLAGTRGADPLVTSDLQKRINNAAVQARERIANLATIQSYGNSQFGLQNRAQDLFNKAGQNIRLQGDIRQGNLAALGVAQQVEPLRYTATPSPWGSIASSLASVAGRGMTAGGGGGGGWGQWGA